MRSRHVSTVIRSSPAEVYAVASDPVRLPDWAAGLAMAEVDADGDTLVVDSPMGLVRVRFVPPNDLGVLDHEVTLPNGTTVYNPLRVLPHPDGAEVVMTVRQLSDDDDEFEQDASAVATDLDRLRAVVEGRGSPVDQAPLRPAEGAGARPAVRAEVHATARAEARPAVTAEVRVAAPADAESVGRLLYAFNTEFDSPTPDAAEFARRFTRLLDRDDVLVVVARLTGGPATDPDITRDVGFAFLTLRPTPLWDGPVAQLEELYVRSDLRSSGIGTEILTLALAEVNCRGCEEILINVDADDADARRFYERHGFSDKDPDSGSGMLCYLRQL